MKPILFNTPMTRAILEGRKTQTRRIVKPQPAGDGSAPEPLETRPGGWNTWGDDNVLWPSYQPGDVLYVRETWGRTFCADASMPKFVYRASDPEWGEHDGWKWHPSILMPKDAARIFLLVADVRVERLWDISSEDVFAEGTDNRLWAATRDAFRRLWDSTIKKADLNRYGWAANPWVWVISFERITREEAEAAMKEGDK